jgi:alpha-tubulin suppressor-like RCC1 family protein
MAASLLMICGIVAVVTAPASASAGPPKPAIRGLSATPNPVTAAEQSVSVTATVTNATQCTLTVAPMVRKNPPVQGSPFTINCSTGSVEQDLALPFNGSARPEKYKVQLVANNVSKMAKAHVDLSVNQNAGGAPLTGVVGLGSDGRGFCSALSTTGVDCWGYDWLVAEKNGTFGFDKIPEAVKGLGDTGTLTGVAEVIGGSDGYCALLTSTGVDCWGYDGNGDLGNGTAGGAHIYPVAVLGVGGSGTLSGVTSLLSDGNNSYCALLTSSEVACWGNELNGDASPYPVDVAGVGGSGTLSGVTSLASDGNGTYCAILTTAELDCWGNDELGSLGDGESSSDSPTPVQVVGVGDTGILGGVTRVVGQNIASFCAELSSGGVDCWGYNGDGELGNGTESNSDSPVIVEGIGGVGSLAGVGSVIGTSFDSYCAQLESGRVDCWGQGGAGQLGDGSVANSPTPVAVEGVGGTGTLSNVSEMTGSGDSNYCALLGTGAVDCWGDGSTGGLGDASFAQSSVPREVVGVGGAGALDDVDAVTGNTSFCAQLTSSDLNCWGDNSWSDLGNGSTTNSATPVVVLAPS